MARAQAARVVYSAAPFEAKAVAEVLLALGSMECSSPMAQKVPLIMSFQQIRCLRLPEFLSSPWTPPEQVTLSVAIL